MEYVISAGPEEDVLYVFPDSPFLRDELLSQF